MENKDFIDVSDEEEVETLDFEKSEVISTKIDEMLDFIDLPQKDTSSEMISLEKVLENAKSENDIEIKASNEKIDEYVPSIRDFNIKSAKKRKIVQKIMVYTVIVMLIGMEFFIEKAGSVLNNLRVYASNNQPIRIIQNDKYGYIDYTGEKIVNPKYTYGEDFIKGYAIVKNSSNLPLIIDKGGKEVIPTGVYFSIYRAKTDIIASKVTKKGLKYGVLDANLGEKVSFEYDSISYLEGVYSYVKGNEVGLINLDGKKIYTYKLSDIDDKKISVTMPTYTSDKFVKYGVVKVNSSSSIVNLTDGKIVSNPTLNEVVAEENNVFYEKNKGTKIYKYVQNNTILVESDSYSSVTVPYLTPGVIRAVTNNYDYEFISTKTLEQLQKGLNNNDTYYGENAFIYKIHNYRKNTDTYNLVKNGEVYKTIDNVSEIIKPYKNGVAIIRYNDGLYGYINEDGNFINDEHYEEANEFDSYGDAIVKKNGLYGVINIKGKTIIDFKYKEIKMASATVKKQSVNNNKNVFYSVREENTYALYNSKGKKVNNAKYTNVIFNNYYPIIKAATDAKDLIITTEDMKEISLTSYNTDYKAYENYIIVKNEYYNYNGKLIYVDNSLGGE